MKYEEYKKLTEKWDFVVGSWKGNSLKTLWKDENNNNRFLEYNLDTLEYHITDNIFEFKNIQNIELLAFPDKSLSFSVENNSIEIESDNDIDSSILSIEQVKLLHNFLGKFLEKCNENT